MAQIKYKKWVLNSDFTVEEVIGIMDLEKSIPDQFRDTVKLFESKRTAGPKITTKILMKEYRALQKKVTESFL